MFETQLNWPQWCFGCFEFSTCHQTLDGYPPFIPSRRSKQELLYRTKTDQCSVCSADLPINSMIITFSFGPTESKGLYTFKFRGQDLISVKHWCTLSHKRELWVMSRWISASLVFLYCIVFVYGPVFVYEMLRVKVKDTVWKIQLS